MSPQLDVCEARMTQDYLWWGLALIPGFLISLFGGVLGIYIGLKLQNFKLTGERKRRTKGKGKRRGIKKQSRPSRDDLQFSSSTDAEFQPLTTSRSRTPVRRSKSSVTIFHREAEATRRREQQQMEEKVRVADEFYKSQSPVDMSGQAFLGAVVDEHSPLHLPMMHESENVAAAAVAAASGFGPLSIPNPISLEQLSIAVGASTPGGFMHPSISMELPMSEMQELQFEGQPPVDPKDVPEKLDASMLPIISSKKPRLIIASYRLPLKIEKVKDEESGESRWQIDYNDSRDFLSNLRICEDKYDVVFVGWPGVYEDEMEEGERDELNDLLYDLRYPCYPVFLTRAQKTLFYDKCCRGVMWTLFHYMTLSCDGEDAAINRDFNSLWQTFQNVNMLYARTAILATDHDESAEATECNTMFWFHNYHLALAPSFIRHRRPNAKIGYFMHTVFPTSETLRVLPTQLEFLRGILSSDLIGFHTFDYARHFLSACKRQLDLDFYTLSDDGTLVVKFLGREVAVRISHVSIRPELVQKLGDSSLCKEIAKNKWQAFAKKRRLVVGIGDVELVHGTVLSLQGLHAFLKRHPKWATEVRFVFVLRRRARTLLGCGKDRDARRLINDEVSLIQREFGEDILMLYKEVRESHEQMLALYRVADVVVFGTFWDGFNTLPYEVTAVQNGRDEPAFIVLSQFMGSSRSLSGVSRINPWDLDAVATAIHEALLMTATERREAHKRRYHHVMTYTFQKWADGFLTDLCKVSQQSMERKVISMGMGATMVNVMLDRHLQKLREVKGLLVASFKNASRRVLLFDYGGTLAKLNDKAMGRPGYIPMNPKKKRCDEFGRSLSSELIAPPLYILKWLENLAARPDTIVCVVSGHTRRELDNAFPDAKQIAFAAEKGAFFKWPGDVTWTPAAGAGLEDCRKWQALATPVLMQYTDRTDGSYIQKKDTALVWHYHDSDPEYGDMQAIELGRHLRRLLREFNVNVQKYDHAKILEILPADIHKGAAAMAVVTRIRSRGSPAAGMCPLKDEDFFILAVGDDRSDEKMFEAMQATAKRIRCEANTYSVTVGIQPTDAHYFLTTQSDIEWLLSTLASCAEFGSRRVPPPLVQFHSVPEFPLTAATSPTRMYGGQSVGAGLGAAVPGAGFRRPVPMAGGMMGGYSTWAGGRLSEMQRFGGHPYHATTSALRDLRTPREPRFKGFPDTFGSTGNLQLIGEGQGHERKSVASFQ